MDDFADLSRRLESLIRYGTILDVRPGKPPRVRVKSGGLDSDWLPWLALRAGDTSDWDPPTRGEQCIVLSPSGEPATGTVLTGLFSDAFPAPSDNPDERVRRYRDGARITYNHATGALSATGIQTAVVEAATHCTVDCPDTTITGNVHIQGTLTVDKLLTYKSGLSGSGGVGGGTSITGPINHQGELINRGTVSSNGIVLDTHTHPGDSGGTTGQPQ